MDAPFKLPLRNGDGWCEIADADGRLVADLAEDNETTLKRQRDYIIAAVNSHAELERERDGLREALTFVIGSTLVSNDSHDPWTCQEMSCAVARAALRAEPKE